MEQKRLWAMEMHKKWGTFAKLVFVQDNAAGLIHYEPIAEERVFLIHCIYIPDVEYWQKGIASQLLSSLVDGAKGRKSWMEGNPAMGFVTRTFHGEKPEQYPARDFFIKKSFKQMEENPDFLYYPLQSGFTYQPIIKKGEYIPQEDDWGKALIIYGPSYCPFSYAFLKMTERAISEIAPRTAIRWINKIEEPGEFKKRGGFEGCIVNGRSIKTFVLDKENFKKEVKQAI